MIFTASFDRNNDLIARKEFAGHIDRLIQQPARVVAQIQNQLAHADFLKHGNRIAQFVIGSVLKAADQTDVAGGGVEHEGVANRGERHRVADNLNVDRGFFAGALNFQLHGLAAYAADIFRDFVAGPIASVLAVDFDDAVAKAQARARRGRAFNDRLNVNAVVVTIDLHTNSVKARSLIFFQLSEFRRREENRVRIKCEEHPLNRGLGGFFVVDFAGVFLFDRGNRFAIIALDSVSFVFLGRGGLICFRGVEVNQRPVRGSRAHAASDTCRDDDQGGDDREISAHKAAILACPCGPRRCEPKI